MSAASVIRKVPNGGYRVLQVECNPDPCRIGPIHKTADTIRTSVQRQPISITLTWQDHTGTWASSARIRTRGLLDAGYLLRIEIGDYPRGERPIISSFKVSPADQDRPVNVLAYFAEEDPLEAEMNPQFPYSVEGTYPMFWIGAYLDSLETIQIGLTLIDTQGKTQRIQINAFPLIVRGGNVPQSEP